VTPDLARRCALLTAALGFALLDTRGKPGPPEVQTVRKWLDNWTGIRRVVTGMNRQGFRLHLTNADESVWRATFLPHADARRGRLRSGPDAVARGAGGGVERAGGDARGAARAGAGGGCGPAVTRLLPYRFTWPTPRRRAKPAASDVGVADLRV
jgi:hypothetical protein